LYIFIIFFFQAEDGIRDFHVTGVQTCALPILKVEFYNGQFIHVEIETEPTKDILKHADFITLHVPAQEDYVIGEKQFNMMKDGVGIINAARGGVIDEVALVKALESGKVAFAGL